MVKEIAELVHSGVSGKPGNLVFAQFGINVGKSFMVEH